MPYERTGTPNAQAQPPFCRSEAKAKRSAGAPCWASCDPLWTIRTWKTTVKPLALMEAGCVLGSAGV
jgi:hypothetical protein